MGIHSIIGVDIGGTKINIGKIVHGQIVKELLLPTGASRSQKEIIRDLSEGIESLVDDNTLGIGIGVPGLVDDQNGIILDVNNIPALKEVNLKNLIESHFSLKVKISNDANCFAIGEKMFGKGKQYHNLVCVSLGTGVGAGVILNDLLYTGTFAIAGEFGGIGYLDNDFEFYCSGKYFNEKYGKNAKALFDDAMKGNLHAIHIFNNFGGHIGNLIKTILLTFGPEAIILGGSISKTYRLFKAGMMDSLQRFPYKRVLENLKIDVCSSDKIAVLGAAALVLAGEIQIEGVFVDQII